MLDLTQGQFLKHVVFHPFEGFDDLRWKKRGSMKISWAILVLFFFQQYSLDRLYGFQYWASYDKIFNIIPYFFNSVVLFLVWVAANWAMCTLFDGEGTMKKIFINSAYALVPYITTGLIGIFISHFLVDEEFIFIELIQMSGTIWTVVLMISAIKSVHQFNLGKTLALIALTVFAMVAVLFLLVLLLTLFQQIIIFVLSIYTELSYRLRV